MGHDNQWGDQIVMGISLCFELQQDDEEEPFVWSRACSGVLGRRNS